MQEDDLRPICARRAVVYDGAYKCMAERINKYQPFVLSGILDKFAVPRPYASRPAGPSGGIGRRDGLKIHYPLKMCRFESGPVHKIVFF